MWGGPPFGTGPQQFGGHFDVRGAVGADVGRGNVGEGVRWIVGGEKTGRNNKIPKPKPHFDEASSLRRSEVSVLVPCCSGPFFLRPRSISLPLRRFSRPTSAPTAPRTSKWPPNCCGPVPKGGPPHITPPFALCILEKTVVEKKPLRSSSAADLATRLRRPSLWLILDPDLPVSLLPVPGADAQLTATRPAPGVQAAEGSHAGAARQTVADLATIDPRGPQQAEGRTRSGLTVRTKPWRLPKVSPTPPCRKPQTPSELLKPQMREAMGSSDRLPPAALTVL